MRGYTLTEAEKKQRDIIKRVRYTSSILFTTALQTTGLSIFLRLLIMLRFICLLQEHTHLSRWFLCMV
jgi:hypothetical protein